MTDKRKEKTNKTCMDRCKFKARNCWMSADGTWDCSTRYEDCVDKCRI
jgi:hypothetical protein